MLLLATMAFAAPKPSTPDRPFPAVLKNARFVYVAAYDGDQFNTSLFPQDREAGMQLFEARARAIPH
jgi:hypothetical protein